MFLCSPAKPIKKLDISIPTFTRNTCSSKLPFELAMDLKQSGYSLFQSWSRTLEYTMSYKDCCFLYRGFPFSKAFWHHKNLKKLIAEELENPTEPNASIALKQ